MAYTTRSGIMVTDRQIKTIADKVEEAGYTSLTVDVVDKIVGRLIEGDYIIISEADVFIRDLLIKSEILSR